jgi:hypothetical protein
MYQSAKFTPNAASPSTTNTALALGNGLSFKHSGDTITSWGIAGGIQAGIPVGPGTLGIMVSGFDGEALGLTFQQDFPLAGSVADALDAVGNERSHWGYIGQATYGFGQGTTVGVSYGESRAGETAFDSLLKNGGVGVVGFNAEIARQSLVDVMLSHDVNPNLKLVAEYGRQQNEWQDDATQDSDIFSLGAFFFW